MNAGRRSALQLALWCALVLLALRPVEPVERALGTALAPLRLVGELARPLTWWRAGEARAAADDLAARQADEWAAIQDLWGELVRQAEPPADLRAGRRLIPAEVLGRPSENRDRLVVRVRDAAGVEVGCPVVFGEQYVGRVHAVDREHQRLEVDLVTGRDFFVGARIDGPRPVWMTVGGVEAGGRSRAGREELLLAVHHPSDRGAAEGEVRVAELLPDVERFGGLARGFSLGELTTLRSGELAVRPRLDYEAGLYHVFVLAPALPGRGAEPALELALARPDDWVPAHPLSQGDPTPRRHGLKLSAGTGDGVRPGAAVVARTRLIGRVLRAGPWTADVQLLADRGLSLIAVARIEGRAEPVVLGRMVSAGRGPERGTVRLLWDAAVPLELGEPDSAPAAVLWTGSGDRGLPGGLRIGTTHLPARVDPRRAPELVVRVDIDGLALDALWVRKSAAEGL